MSEVQTAKANARVNLIGDHTDYNGGCVLPMLLPLETTITGQLTSSGKLVARSEGFDAITRPLDDKPAGNWTDYVLGCLGGFDLPGLDITVSSTIPAGASVSSSAALEIAALRLVRGLTGSGHSDLDLAKIAHRAENDYVGMPCGMMDQMVISCAAPDQAFFFDTRSMEINAIDVPFTTARFVTIHSGVSRQLVDGAYAERRATCEAVAAKFSVETLRELTLDDIVGLEGKHLKRARHAIAETDAVLSAVQALKANKPEQFGALMTASHWSLARDYETSVPDVDALVETCLSAGAYGARITGAGFGGCIVALHDDPQALMTTVETKHPNARFVA